MIRILESTDAILQTNLRKIGEGLKSYIKQLESVAVNHGKQELSTETVQELIGCYESYIKTLKDQEITTPVEEAYRNKIDSSKKALGIKDCYHFTYIQGSGIISMEGTLITNKLKENDKKDPLEELAKQVEDLIKRINNLKEKIADKLILDK